MASVPSSPSPLQCLDWDTALFGWKTARLIEPRLSSEQLLRHLAEARNEGVRLVYWCAADGCQPCVDVLETWSGSLVDRKATFRLDLARRIGPIGRGDQTVRIDDHPRCEASPELVELAIGAGQCSRFRRDPRIPQAAFRQLYEAWIQRSVAGEIADRVFVASRGEVGPIGLVTVVRRGDSGAIGLVSVAASSRRQGIGGLLVNQALDWIESSGMSSATVVTQLDNAAACRLYERLHFERSDVTHVYHFWPSELSLS